MRHHDITRHQWTFTNPHVGTVIYRPYNYGNWSWTKPNKDRRYVQILQFVYDHPNCTRAEIYEAVWGGKFTSGSQSKTFANMLYDDLIDYDKNYRYTIRPFGMKILKQSYVNDNLKLINK